MSTRPIASAPAVASPNSVESVERLVSAAMSEPLEPIDSSSTVAGYRLKRQLSSGADGLAYEAEEVDSGRLVEFRQLSARFRDPDALKRMRVLLARLSYVKDVAVRRVMRFDDVPYPFVVCETSGSLKWREWSQSSEYSPAKQLEVLQVICRALIEAQRHGCQAVEELSDKVSMVDSQPRLDLTGLDVTSGSVHGNKEVADAPDDETKSFATWLGECHVQPEFATFVRDLAPRHHGQMSQLICSAQDGTFDQLPTLEEFYACLSGIANIVSPSHVNETPSSGTAEILVAPVQPDNPDSTRFEPSVESGSSSGDQSLSGLFAAPAPATLTELRCGELLGRYRIETKIGEGGMGAVFRATDTTDDRTVAIKVLSRSAQLKSQALNRFRKEARVLTSLRNPYITNLIEVSEERGQCYIVLEFVDGVDLSRVVRTLGTIPVNAALNIVADVARGLLDAHQRDMIHRDIKPDNILIEKGGNWLDSEYDSQVHRARLTDFGIARQVDQSKSMAMTQAGGLLGTPLYMSPEQCKGMDAGPQADVYSLGITLFQLLTGQTPFQADETLKLIGMHCFEAPPPVQRIDPRISDGVGAIVAKCLAKKPSDRYADASHLLEAIERELRGEASTIQIHPLLPKSPPGSVSTNEMTWEFASSPEQLWPHVSNTERVNRAMGLPPVEYVTERDASGAMRRYATVKFFGMKMRWEEHPFEWIEGRRMSVLREFEGGPFQWFSSTVELEPLPAGGTRLKHTVRMAGRNWLGRLIAGRETGSKCRKTLDTIYSRIDATLREKSQSVSYKDPFEPAKPLGAQVIRRIDGRLRRMEENGVSLDLVGKLREYIVQGSPQELAKLRPLMLSEQLGTDSRETTDACLAAVDAGLLRMEWEVLCPTCRVAADTKTSLKELTTHTNCEACAVDFRSDLATAVEMVFRIHSDILDTRIGKFCIGGPAHTPHVVAQVRCEPGERIELPLSLPVGNYLLRGPNWKSTLSLDVRSHGAPSRIDVDIRQDVRSSLGPTLRAGQQLIVVLNRTDVVQVLRLERTIPREHVVTAAQAMALPGFRERFPLEVLDTGRVISSENVTLLTTRIANIDDCYARLGQRESFELIQRQIELIQSRVRSRRGDTVKIVGEGVLAVFENVDGAVLAAFDIRDDLAKDESLAELAVVTGIHRGSAIVTTINQRLDYFGPTSRQVQALPAVVDKGIVLTDSVYSDPIVQDFLRSHGAPQIRVVDLPGRPQQLLHIY
jgi:serine/threonine protein kinase/class 3 adenylate cyclase